MKLSALVQDLPFTRLVAGDVEVRAVVTDSRAVEPGALFFAREGWFVDSHAFIPAAIEAGAVAVIVTREDAAAGLDVPVHLSNAEDRDLGLLCDRFFGAPTEQLAVFGITGTNGKTSSAFLLEHILRGLGERPAVIGTVTHRFEHISIPARNTTPDGLTIHGFARRAADAGATCLIIEVSSHGAELDRIAGVAFEAVGFTNLTPDHLDFHDTFEAYFEAKARLFGPCLLASAARGKQPVAAAWVEDPAGPRMLARAADQARCVSVGWNADADLRIAVTERLGARGVRFAVETAAASATGMAPVVGEHNVANIALSLAMVTGWAGGRLSDAVAALRDFPGIPGRFERAYDASRGAPCFVDYAHTPDAVERAATVIGDLGAGPTTVVLGCGGDRDATKRGPMAAAAARLADRVVVTSDNPRSEAPGAIIDQMLAGVPDDAGAEVVRVDDRSEAIAYAVATAEGPILLAGKGHETYQEIGGTRFHFDDREEARRALVAARTGVPCDAVPLLSGWSAERVANEAGGAVTRAGIGAPWGPLTTDSRAIEPHGIFVALEGDRFDGHAFIGKAVDAGVGLVVVRRGTPVPGEHVAVVEVTDTLRALQRIAAALLAEGRRREGGLRVAAVTGSNGKTSTKEVLAAILGETALVTPGNFNNHIGLPLAVAPLAPRHRFAVLEMGANGPKDIAELAEIARPEVGVVTSIGLAHVEGFGDLNGVRAAKAGIAAAGLETLILPHDEAALPQWADARGAANEVVTFGEQDAACIGVGRDGVSGPVRIRVPNASFDVALPLPGRHNASNLGAAVGAASALGAPVSAERINAALADLELPGGRLRRLDIGGRTVIDDAYNANPASVVASLGILAELPSPRVAVLGEMLELGPSSATLHADVGRAAVDAADVVVVVGAGAAGIARGAEESGEAREFTSREAAAAWLAGNVPVGASLLLKGSRGAGLETIIPNLRDAWEGDR